MVFLERGTSITVSIMFEMWQKCDRINVSFLVVLVFIHHQHDFIIFRSRLLSHHNKRNIFAFNHTDFWCFETCAETSFFITVILVLVKRQTFANDISFFFSIISWYRYQSISFLFARIILSCALFHFHSVTVSSDFRVSYLTWRRASLRVCFAFHSIFLIDFNFV